MKRWALLVVVLYAMFLGAALFSVFAAAFYPDSVAELSRQARDALKTGSPDLDSLTTYLLAGAWCWVAVFVLAQVALLVVPVKVASRRPVRRGAIVWPLLVSIVMLLLMVAAMYITVYEHLDHTRVPTGELWDTGMVATEGLSSQVWTIVFAVIGGMWLIWTFLFGFYAGGREPRTFMSRVCRFLLAGSILELLVAVPAHVIARQRDYCCAGFGTFVGLVTGVSVMLLAFGPGVFLLIARRVAATRPPRR